MNNNFYFSLLFLSIKAFQVFFSFRTPFITSTTKLKNILLTKNYNCNLFKYKLFFSVHITRKKLQMKNLKKNLMDFSTFNILFLKLYNHGLFIC